MVKGCGVELYKFHVFYRTFGSVNHGNAVACCHKRIGGVAVNGTYAAGSHQCNFRQECVNFAGCTVQYVGPVTSYVGCAARDNLAEVVLGAYFHGKTVFKNVDIRVQF